jgi:glycosyltransferase involved in cell wall biosynthesis
LKWEKFEMPILFTEIDLTQPIQPIYLDERYNRLFVVVQWGFFPIGLLQLKRDSAPHLFTAEELQRKIREDLSWNLWELSAVGLLEQFDRFCSQPLPSISVVVCTRDRALSLQSCLEALTQLEYPKYEVIVIDNCSKDPSIAGIASGYGFRYVREDRPGLDWARNRGFLEAKHDIVAYVDDDALARPGWLRGVAFGFREPEVMAVTGMVLPAEIETSAQNDFERYGGMSKGFRAFSIYQDDLSDEALYWASSWGVGANMAFRRSLFKAIGGFDVALDVGTPTNGAGDIEFFHRTISSGYLLRYEPSAMVRHFHRRDRSSLVRQIYNNGRSFPAYLLTIARKNPRNRLAVFLFSLRWWIWHWLLRRIIISIVKRDPGTLQLAVTELKGAFSSVGAYRKSQKLARQYLGEN